MMNHHNLPQTTKIKRGKYTVFNLLMNPKSISCNALVLRHTHARAKNYFVAAPRLR